MQGYVYPPDLAGVERHIGLRRMAGELAFATPDEVDKHPRIMGGGLRDDAVAPETYEALGADARRWIECARAIGAEAWARREAVMAANEALAWATRDQAACEAQLARARGRLRPRLRGNLLKRRWRAVVLQGGGIL